jgi:hypothetical protein
VPELARFYGIVIQMFREQGEPHFHATYGEHVAVFSVGTIELIAGWLPRRQRRLVEAGAELHRAELSEDWRRLQAGLPARPIAPLR